MNFFLVSLLLVVAGGIAACLLPAAEKVRVAAGVAIIIAGSVWGTVIAAGILAGGTALDLKIALPLPLGSFSVGIDSLSGFFLCVILGLTALAALYGAGYQGPSGRNPGDRFAWLWFALLAVAMALTAIARNAILFLLGWELMALSSFFLVAYESNREQVRRAAWMYLVATHLGTAFLLAMFVLMAAKTGSFDYESFRALRGERSGFLNLLFILAVIGFGTKAGFFPLHVWLPEAHPAAPSHVSALMSGVMIKTGVYALIRFGALFGTPPAWWGWLVIAVGAVSGVLGVVFALAQHDLKRLLAYHSVENIGIIALGIGLGFLGWSSGRLFIMAAGFAGALLHVANHAVFKGLLFFAAGSVVRATGWRNLEQMGGLLKRMPLTGAAFFTGSAAISGLPPLNGFISEFLIYAAALSAVMQSRMGIVLPGIAVIGALALIGGLAAACFAKAFGVVFLGEPRNRDIAGARECAWTMWGPMLVLSAACLGIALLAPFILPFLFAAAGGIVGLPLDSVSEHLALLETAVRRISMACSILFVLLAGLAVSRLILLKGRTVERTVTWDCGFARPAARMQYTASSFAQPILSVFRRVTDIRVRAHLPAGFFPQEASFESHANDTAQEYLFKPFFRHVGRSLSFLRRMQEGRVQVYVFYIAITLLILLLTAL